MLGFPAVLHCQSQEPRVPKVGRVRGPLHQNTYGNYGRSNARKNKIKVSYESKRAKQKTEVQRMGEEETTENRRQSGKRSQQLRHQSKSQQKSGEMVTHVSMSEPSAASTTVNTHQRPFVTLFRAGG